MKRINLITVFYIVQLIFVIVQASPLRQELHEGWIYRQARGINWYTAEVPGTIHTDLINSELIDDPFYRLNERGVQWVDKEDWIYRTTFDVDKQLLDKSNIMICFDGLDTYADVILNGVKILSTDNMFRRWSVDVKKLLGEKENELEVYFHSPVKVDLPKWEKAPFHYPASNDQSENGGLLDRQISVYARKAGYHYGWDWGPRLVTSGIWRPVFLEAWDDVRITNVYYAQKSVTAREARIDAIVEICADKEMDAETLILNRTDNRTEIKKTIRLVKGTNKISLPFSIIKPKLWWTNGLGEAFLYDFAMNVKIKNREVDAYEQKVGLRSLKLATEKDKYGENFYFELNGQPLFAKGSNYIPCDNFLPRVTDSLYERTIQDAVRANMNMLRVWGGGIYENDIFYDLCDKNGILVWQDFMFACSKYPADGDFLENIKQEAIDNVRRLRNHACIALWCGNNECIDAWCNWGWKRDFDKQNPKAADVIWEQYKKQYSVVLPEIVKEHHPEAYYRQSSPYSDEKGTRNVAVGDYHYWDVWQGLKSLSEFNHARSRFFSEYGFQSFPEFESIKRYTIESDWALTSEVMMAHQRGGINANTRINDFLLAEYHKPKDFPSFVYMSQLLQADAMKMAMEAHRRDMPYCMGSLVWQHNDCWPVASWSSRDYYGRWKAQHYFTVKSFSDILISPIEEEGKLKVFAVSDRLKKAIGRLTVDVIDLRKGVVTSRCVRADVAANTSKVIWIGDIRDLLGNLEREDVVLRFTWQDNQGQAYTNSCFLAKQKEMNYPKVHIATTIIPVKDGYEITLKSDAFARAVFLSIIGDTDNFISDNYIDLFPNESVTVSVQTQLSMQDVRDKLNVISFVDTY